MADATMLTASALLTTKGKAQAAERQEHNGKLSKGDVAILDSWLRRILRITFANGRSNLNGDLHLFVDDTGIDSAKSECVAKNVRQIFFARLVGNHIQIARWIGSLIIQSRWD